jgi:hypothetical protein
MDDGNNRGGSSGSAGAAGSGTGGSAGSATGGVSGSAGSSTGGAGGTAGSAGSAGSAGTGTGGEGGFGGEGGEGEGGEGGTTTGGVGGAGAGGAGMAGKGGTGGKGGAGAGGAGSGGKAGGGGTGGSGGKAGGGGAGDSGGTAGAGGAAGSGGTAGAGAGGGGGTGGMPPVTPNLYFSEYYEGSATNEADAFEIFNATNMSVSLNGCEVRVHYAAAAGSTSVTLMGSLAAGDVFVLCRGSRITTACDSVVAALPDLSGDDAVELVCSVGGTTTILDVIGRYGMGVDPGASWGSGTTSTQNNTLRRDCDVTQGDRTPGNVFNPSAQWTGFGANNVSGLGARTCPCPMPDLTCP